MSFELLDGAAAGAGGAVASAGCILSRTVTGPRRAPVQVHVKMHAAEALAAPAAEGSFWQVL